ncbi:MAG: hypothetical protein O7B26_05780, partial [Planctomycetota bacterium]|nr:hypothetical protein [Planctomycetota bacterium]
RLIAALVIAAFPAKAAADWQEYVYPEDHFAIQFPAEPRLRTAPYETLIASGVSAHVYSVEFENILFEATVVDLDGLIEQGANFVLEAAHTLQRAGDVIFNDVPRIGFGSRIEFLTFGLTTVVDTDDGRRIRSSSYVWNGRFYKIDAIVLPARGDKDQAVPSRFDQTLRFDVAGL